MKKLYFNGDFVPMTGEGDTFEALLVADDGTIAFTGSLEEARAQTRLPCKAESNAATEGVHAPLSHQKPTSTVSAAQAPCASSAT